MPKSYTYLAMALMALNPLCSVVKAVELHSSLVNASSENGQSSGKNGSAQSTKVQNDKIWSAISPIIYDKYNRSFGQKNTQFEIDEVYEQCEHALSKRYPNLCAMINEPNHDLSKIFESEEEHSVDSLSTSLSYCFLKYFYFEEFFAKKKDADFHKHKLLTQALMFRMLLRPFQDKLFDDKIIKLTPTSKVWDFFYDLLSRTTLNWNKVSNEAMDFFMKLCPRVPSSNINQEEGVITCGSWFTNEKPLVDFLGSNCFFACPGQIKIVKCLTKLKHPYANMLLMKRYSNTQFCASKNAFVRGNLALDYKFDLLDFLLYKWSDVIGVIKKRHVDMGADYGFSKKTLWGVLEILANNLTSRYQNPDTFIIEKKQILFNLCCKLREIDQNNRWGTMMTEMLEFKKALSLQFPQTALDEVFRDDSDFRAYDPQHILGSPNTVDKVNIAMKKILRSNIEIIKKTELTELFNSDSGRFQKENAYEYIHCQETMLFGVHKMCFFYTKQNAEKIFTIIDNFYDNNWEKPRGETDILESTAQSKHGWLLFAWSIHRGKAMLAQQLWSQKINGRFVRDDWPFSCHYQGSVANNFKNMLKQWHIPVWVGRTSGMDGVAVPCFGNTNDDKNDDQTSSATSSFLFRSRIRFLCKKTFFSSKETSAGFKNATIKSLGFYQTIDGLFAPTVVPLQDMLTILLDYEQWRPTPSLNFWESYNPNEEPLNEKFSDMVFFLEGKNESGAQNMTLAKSIIMLKHWVKFQLKSGYEPYMVLCEKFKSRKKRYWQSKLVVRDDLDLLVLERNENEQSEKMKISSEMVEDLKINMQQLMDDETSIMRIINNFVDIWKKKGYRLTSGQPLPQDICSCIRNDVEKIKEVRVRWNDPTATMICSGILDSILKYKKSGTNIPDQKKGINEINDLYNKYKQALCVNMRGGCFIRKPDILAENNTKNMDKYEETKDDH